MDALDPPSRRRRAASEQSIADLVARHQEGIWRYLRYLGCEPLQAEDLLQETFLAVLRQPFEQRSPEESRAYLRTVARNVFLMAERKKAVALYFESIEEADRGWANYSSDEGDAYRSALALCLEELSERSRRAIRLQYYDGCSRAEIAERLGGTLDGVKTLMRRSRDFLRRCINRRLTS